MSQDKPFNLASFISANAGNVSNLDYVHTVYKSEHISNDFIFCISKLFWPDFKIVDGLIFITELFDLNNYHQLIKDGKNKEEAQFWINLLEITGIFDELPYEQAIEIAESIIKCWNAKLHNEYGESYKLAHAIYENELQEVFVTIGINPKPA